MLLGNLSWENEECLLEVEGKIVCVDFSAVILEDYRSWQMGPKMTFSINQTPSV